MLAYLDAEKDPCSLLYRIMMAGSYSSLPTGKKGPVHASVPFQPFGLKFTSAIPQEHLSLGAGMLSPWHCASSNMSILWRLTFR